MLISLLCSWLTRKSEDKAKNQTHTAPVFKLTAASTNISMNPGACRLLLKEEQMKDENAVKVSSQGKVPTVLLSSGDM
jgi:hypothetical protein